MVDESRFLLFGVTMVFESSSPLDFNIFRTYFLWPTYRQFLVWVISSIVERIIQFFFDNVDFLKFCIVGNQVSVRLLIVFETKLVSNHITTYLSEMPGS